MEIPIEVEIDNYGQVLIYQKMWYRKTKLDECPVCGGDEEAFFDCEGINSRCKTCGQPMNFGMIRKNSVE